MIDRLDDVLKDKLSALGDRIKLELEIRLHERFARHHLMELAFLKPDPRFLGALRVLEGKDGSE